MNGVVEVKYLSVDAKSWELYVAKMISCEFACYCVSSHVALLWHVKQLGVVNNYLLFKPCFMAGMKIKLIVLLKSIQLIIVLSNKVKWKLIK